MDNKIKVHIADDHKILIDGLTRLLNTEDSIEVEGSSVTGKQVLDWYKKGKADILILDINMPGLDGIEVMKKFQSRNIKQKTIILSGLSDPSIVQEMIALGVSSFIEKSNADEHIIEAIKAVHSGKEYYSKEIKDNLFELYVMNAKTNELIKSLAKEPLTRREIDVLKLITKELSSPQIAKKLDLGVKTVEATRRILYKKLRVKNVVGLAMYAVKNNIV